MRRLAVYSRHEPDRLKADARTRLEQLGASASHFPYQMLTEEDEDTLSRLLADVAAELVFDDDPSDG